MSAVGFSASLGRVRGKPGVALPGFNLNPKRDKSESCLGLAVKGKVPK